MPPKCRVRATTDDGVVIEADAVSWTVDEEPMWEIDEFFGTASELLAFAREIMYRSTRAGDRISAIDYATAEREARAKMKIAVRGRCFEADDGDGDRYDEDVNEDDEE